MPDSDRPQGPANGEPLSFDEGVAALETILDPPEQEPVRDQVQNEDDDEEAEAEASESDAENPDNEPEDDGESSDEADDEDDDASEDDGDDGDTPEALELSDDTEITLEDGKRVTFADLKADYGQVQKRVADFQRDYTEKTTALSDRSKEVDTQEQRVMEHAQKLKQQREETFAIARQLLPQPPEPPQVNAEDDPVAWSIYHQQKTAYDRQQTAVNQLGQEIRQQQQQARQEQEEKFAKYAQAEWDALVEKRPELKDDATVQKLNTEIIDVFGDKYGIKPEELGQFVDHRFRDAMLDLLEYHRTKAKVPAAKAKVTGKPKMLKSGRAQSQQDKSSKAKKQKADRLKRTGELESFVDWALDENL